MLLLLGRRTISFVLFTKIYMLTLIVSTNAQHVYMMAPRMHTFNGALHLFF